ncbi:MAG: ABC transporter permease [Candidatus Lindowbacteria bacterium]|nr:ABC transporter permease [Candidatus Lindowbacteria bacterium]
MFLLESINQAWQSLRGHKLRTALTMFGIIWGIASMIILVGMGRSSQRLFTNEFQKIGQKWVIVWAGQSSSGLSGIKGGRQIRFTLADIQAIMNHCPAVELASPQISIGYEEIKHGSEVVAAEVFGLDENSQTMRNMTLDEGRFILSDDVRLGRRVCVLGKKVKQKLFGDRRATGDFVRVAGMQFEIVGVLTEKGDQLSRESRSMDDDQVSIPYTTAQDHFTGSKYFYAIYFQPFNIDKDKTAREEVRQVLALRHGFEPDDSDALHMFGIAEMVGRVTGVTIGMQIFLGAASIVTLLIGGIGVMNIMFVSINERIHEIGIIKAVGAKQRQVFLQFMVESIFVTFFAGLIGVIVGCSTCIILGMIQLPRFVAAPEIDPFVMTISFLAITVVGILSGILPALKGSRMQIVEALRSY